MVNMKEADVFRWLMQERTTRIEFRDEMYRDLAHIAFRLQKIDAYFSLPWYKRIFSHI